MGWEISSTLGYFKDTLICGEELQIQKLRNLILQETVYNERF